MATLRQGLHQKQQLKLTPQQMLVQKLLQLPVPLMEQRIKEEIENNPALEEVTENEWDAKDEQEIDNEDVPSAEDNDDFDASDFMEESDEYVPAYKLSANNTSPDDERKEMPIAATSSFHDSITQQLGLRNLSERQLMLADYIIGNIDDDGYLQVAELFDLFVQFYQLGRHTFQRQLAAEYAHKRVEVEAIVLQLWVLLILGFFK